MWLLFPLLGAAAGAWLGRESPATVWTMMAIMLLIVLIGLGDPALAVVVLGMIVACIIALIILCNIIPILLFMFGFILALAFVIVVISGLFKLAGI